MAIRDDVLGGRFFGAKRAEEAAALAAWLAEGDRCQKDWRDGREEWGRRQEEWRRFVDEWTAPSSPRDGEAFRQHQVVFLQARIAFHQVRLAFRDARLSLRRAWFGDAASDAILAGPEPAEQMEEVLDRDMTVLDALLSRQLDAVLHHPRLAAFEGSWRGLHWLIERADMDRSVRVRLLPIRWAELSRDLERAVEFDQSNLFRKLHDEEFGIAGGEPFSLMLVDHPVRPNPAPGHPTDDVAVIGRLAAVAAAAFAPMLLPASPAMLGLDSFAEAGAAADLTVALRAPDRTRWRSLAAREDTRFVSLILPRTLGRPAWRADGTRADRFRYRERVAGDPDRVWTAPIYGFAAVALRAFVRYRWPAELRGAEPSAVASGGVVEFLPVERLPSDPPGPPPRPPLELVLTDEQERALADAQVVAMCGLDGLPEASFSALPTLHRPPRMTTEVADANQRLSAQLNNVLCVSRFAHCVKVLGRDMVGSFLSADEMQFRLTRWIERYTGGSGGGEAGARFPLKAAEVQVREQPGRPGSYGCVMHLQPHYQLDDVTAVFRLTSELTGPRAA